MALDEIRTFPLTLQNVKWIRPDTVLNNIHGERMYVGRISRNRIKGPKVVLFIPRADGATGDKYNHVWHRDLDYGWDVSINITESTKNGLEFPTAFYEETERNYVSSNDV